MDFSKWPDANGWIDIVDHSILAVFMLLIAVVPAIIAARNTRGIRTIQQNVVNGHTKPMREDLDRAIAAIELLTKDVSNFRQAISSEVFSLRQEVTTEEARRRSNIDEVRADTERKFLELRRLASGE